MIGVGMYVHTMVIETYIDCGGWNFIVYDAVCMCRDFTRSQFFLSGCCWVSGRSVQEPAGPEGGLRSPMP